MADGKAEILTCGTEKLGYAKRIIGLNNYLG